MKQLGDQWIEIIDGQEHMVKVGLSMKGEACRGCIYMGRVDECLHPYGCPMQNQFDPTTIVKDLGILRDGVLHCPFCGEYPVLSNNDNGYFVACDNCYIPQSAEQTEQEAKDAWNRRV